MRRASAKAGKPGKSRFRRAEHRKMGSTINIGFSLKLVISIFCNSSRLLLVPNHKYSFLKQAGSKLRISAAGAFWKGRFLDATTFVSTYILWTDFSKRTCPN